MATAVVVTAKERERRLDKNFILSLSTGYSLG